MKITQLQELQEKATFILQDATPMQANTLRRAIVSLVPTLAIDTVDFYENSNALYDEVIALRLGLLPLTTDLDSYSLRSDFPDDGVHRPECEVKLSLDVKGPCVVYADQMKAKDPAVKCAYGKTPIVKLLKNQSLKFEATAVLGQAKDHAKWAAGLAYYQLLPTVKNGEKKVDIDFSKLMNEKSQEILVQKDGSLNIDSNAKNASVSQSEGNYLFVVESFGQLKPTRMIKEALNQLNKELDKVQDLIKNIE